MILITAELVCCSLRKVGPETSETCDQEDDIITDSFV